MDSKQTNDRFEDFEYEDLDPLDVKPISKKSMVIFFVIDTSESMKGDKIKDLNDIMREMLPDLAGVGGANTDVKYAVLSFSSGCQWETPEPLPVDDQKSWKDLEASGITDLGMALDELNMMLSRKKFLKSPALSYAPVIFLMSDGYPTDNYKKALESLKQNNWYKYGIKVALGIGEYFNKKVLEEFTDNIELVVKASNKKQLLRLVRTIAVTSSQIGSKSMTLSKDDDIELSYEDVVGNKEKEMEKVVQDTIKDEEFTDLEYEDGWE